MRLIVLATLISLIGISDAGAERRTTRVVRTAVSDVPVDTVSSAGTRKRLAEVELDLPDRLAMREVDKKPTVDLVLKIDSHAVKTRKQIWKEMLIRMRDNIYEPFPSGTITMGTARNKIKRVKVRSFFLGVPSANGTCPGFGAIGKF